MKLEPSNCARDEMEQRPLGNKRRAGRENPGQREGNNPLCNFWGDSEWRRWINGQSRIGGAAQEWGAFWNAYLIHEWLQGRIYSAVCFHHSRILNYFLRSSDRTSVLVLPNRRLNSLGLCCLFFLEPIGTFSTWSEVNEHHVLSLALRKTRFPSN